MSVVQKPEARVYVSTKGLEKAQENPEWLKRGRMGTGNAEG